MKRIRVFIYGVALAAVALLTARETIDASVFVYQERLTNMAALGVFG
jgi:hypothetical protein